MTEETTAPAPAESAPAPSVSEAAPTPAQSPAPSDHQEAPISDTRAAVRASLQDFWKDQQGELPGEAAGAEPVRDERGRFAKEKPDADASSETPETPETPQNAAAPEAGQDQPQPSDETPTAIGDAPARFSAEAKAAWKDAPAPVRAEVERALGELETGIRTYQQRMQPLEQLKPQLRGEEPATALAAALNWQTLMERDFAGGVRQLAAALGKQADLEDVALALMDAEPSAPNPQISALERQVAALTHQLQQQHVQFAEQQQARQMAELEAVVAELPRYDELHADMLALGHHPEVQAAPVGAARIRKAYDLAERLKPATPPAQPAPTPRPHTPAANLSVSGAPAGGSNPTMNGSTGSLRGDVRRALTATGLTRGI